MYSSLSRVPPVNSSGEPQNLSFCKGLKLLESGCVENVLQVGKYYLTNEYLWVSCFIVHITSSSIFNFVNDGWVEKTQKAIMNVIQRRF